MGWIVWHTYNEKVNVLSKADTGRQLIRAEINVTHLQDKKYFFSVPCEFGKRCEQLGCQSGDI